MFIDVTNKPIRLRKKAQTIVPKTLVILIVVLALVGVVSYIIYTRIIQGRLTFP